MICSVSVDIRFDNRLLSFKWVGIVHHCMQICFNTHIKQHCFKTYQLVIMRAIQLTFRYMYIDDVLSLKNSKFSHSGDFMYHHELLSRKEQTPKSDYQVT